MASFTSSLQPVCYSSELTGFSCFTTASVYKSMKIANSIDLTLAVGNMVALTDNPVVIEAMRRWDIGVKCKV